jgi:hypothetical protein
MADYAIPATPTTAYAAGVTPDLSREQVLGNITTASQDWMLGRDTSPDAVNWAQAQYKTAGMAAPTQAPSAALGMTEWWAGPGGQRVTADVKEQAVRANWGSIYYIKPATMSQTAYNQDLATKIQAVRDRTTVDPSAGQAQYDAYRSAITGPEDAQYAKELVSGANALPPPGSMWAGGGGSSVANPYMPAAGSQYQTLVEKSQQVADQQSAALQAAQGRADSLPDQYAAREQNLTQYLEGLGQSQRDELSRSEQGQQSALKQDMINRGMISSSVLDSLRGGITSNFGQQRRSLEDTLTREKMDYRSALSGETLGARGQAIQGARDTASGVFQMQQSPLQAREAYASALAKQREYDLNWSRDRQTEQYRTALGYAQLRSQEGIDAQQRQLERHKTNADQFMNYSQLVNALRLKDMQIRADLTTGQVGPGATYMNSY